MLRRINTKPRGMKEADTPRLVQAFASLHRTYVGPYAILSKGDLARIDAMVRKAYKHALRLAINTLTDRLLKFDLNNTAGQLVEAQLASQRLRLSTTPGLRMSLLS